MSVATGPAHIAGQGHVVSLALQTSLPPHASVCVFAGSLVVSYLAVIWGHGELSLCFNCVCRTCKVTVDGEEKFTAPAKGRDAAIDETLEFILGRKEIQGHDQLSVNIEVWDYRLINHFKVRKRCTYTSRLAGKFAYNDLQYHHCFYSYCIRKLARDWVLFIHSLQRCFVGANLCR